MKQAKGQITPVRTPFLPGDGTASNSEAAPIIEPHERRDLILIRTENLTHETRRTSLNGGEY